MKYLFIFILIFCLLAVFYPYLSIAETTSVVPEQFTGERGTQNLPKAPGNFEEAKTMGKKFLVGLPGVFKKSWQKGLNIWNKIFKWFRGIWNSYAAPWTQKLWNRIKGFLGVEIEKKKPEIQKEFQKEKQEMKEDIPRVGKSLWQRFKELIQ